MQTQKKLKVVFLAYREWALKTIEMISEKNIVDILMVVQSKEEYDCQIDHIKKMGLDCIVLLGWSWVIKDDILLNNTVVGMHPSDLPLFRGGSPIQHQIISGLEKTKISLMTISPDGIDAGDIWLKENWDLTGSSMSEILNELTNSSYKLLLRFFCQYDKLIPQKQDLTKGSFYKRRTPAESEISWDALSKMSLKETYNLIRALGDPYPNLYIKDEYGNRLLFKEVRYEKACKEE